MLYLMMLATVLTACASNAPRADHPDELVRERRVEIAAGKVVELNLDVPVSTIVAAMPIDPIEVVFEGSGELAWNIHVHQDGKVEILAEGTHLSGVIRHVPSRPGPISVLWENRSAQAVSATIRVDRLPAGTTAEWYP